MSRDTLTNPLPSLCDIWWHCLGDLPPHFECHLWFIIHSVLRIVALVSALGIELGPCMVQKSLHGALHKAMQVSKDCALFFNLCMWRIKVTNETKVIISIFWLWRPGSLTLAVWMAFNVLGQIKLHSAASSIIVTSLLRISLTFGWSSSFGALLMSASLFRIVSFKEDLKIIEQGSNFGGSDFGSTNFDKNIGTDFSTGD